MEYEGTISGPDTSQQSWKKKLREEAVQVWQGLHMITKAIEPALPQPAKLAFQIFNIISDAAVVSFAIQSESALISRPEIHGQ